MMSHMTRRAARRRQGFTLIEVLVVMAILGVLVSFVLVAANRHRITAAEEATRSLIQRIEIGMDSYYGYKNSYPPDGIDTEVTNEEGVRIQGAACLHHFLGKEFEVAQNVAGERRRKTVKPLVEFRGSAELFEDPDDDGVFEVIDAFGTPLHYDNTQNGEFEPQDGSVHLEAVRDHPPDPREDRADGVVTKEGTQGRQYNIWAHGYSRHDPRGVMSTIASWSLRRSTDDGENEDDDE